MLGMQGLNKADGAAQVDMSAVDIKGTHDGLSFCQASFSGNFLNRKEQHGR